MREEKDQMGSRLKQYENLAEQVMDIANIPTIIRLDGRGFSKFTKGLDRPFDEKFTEIMVKTAEDLMAKFKFNFVYTQSDEITCVFPLDKDPEFSGRVQKLVSVIAAYATARFNLYYMQSFPENTNRHGEATFDSRMFQLPNITEAMNTVLWRFIDCRKNSKTTFGRAYLSHKRIQNLSSQEIVMVAAEEKGVVWSDLPERNKYGTCLLRVLKEGTAINPVNGQETTFIRAKPTRYSYEMFFNDFLCRAMYGEPFENEIPNPYLYDDPSLSINKCELR